jgi:predicted nucleotidyltransferase
MDVMQSLTNNHSIDLIIKEVMGEWEREFPNRIISWYLMGSYAYGGATPGSDVDLVFVMSDEEETVADQERAEKLFRAQQSRYPIKLELWGVPQSDLRNLGRHPKVPISLVHAVSLKNASRLISGVDLRDEITQPSSAEYQQKLMEIAFKWIDKFSQKPTSPPYYGYVEGNRTDAIVYVVLSIAAALSVKKSGTLLFRKNDFYPHYHDVIGDDWTQLVADVHNLVWQKWGYSVPVDASDTMSLSKMCQRAKAFEEHFLKIYGSH